MRFLVVPGALGLLIVLLALLLIWLDEHNNTPKH